ncbi:MAG: aromatic ring-hydroxylating dioxygenase subunit alpha, partial [Myxococcota bacterium]
MRIDGDLPSTEHLEALVAAQPDGCALLQPFYNDPVLFERDMDRIHLSRWLCAGHVSRVPEPGDWFRFDLAGESLIIVRDTGRKLRALVNVCRHRGSRVCQEESGQARRLVCPYHAWTYDLEGRLRAARNMPGLDLAAHSLASVHCRVDQGLIFVCFAEEPPEFAHVAEALAQSLGRYGWAGAKVAHRASYPVAANWKLVTENYQECYHCRPAHPEFSRSHATERPDEETEELRRAASDRAAAQGIEIPEVDDWPSGGGPGREMIGTSNDAMYEGSLTGSRDGSPVAPLMGDFDDYFGGFMTY